MVGKVKELCVENRFPLVSTNHHLFHVVMQDLCWYSLKVFKTSDVTIQKDLQGTSLDKFYVEKTAITKYHQKHILRRR